MLEREIYRSDGGGGGPAGGTGSQGPHRRPGQCQGALTEVILISLSRDKIPVPLCHLRPFVSESVTFLTSFNC